MSSLGAAFRKIPLVRPAGRASRRFLELAPRPVSFWDDVRRPSTEGVARLFRLWRNVPPLAQESESAYEAYDGGDVIDVGSFHGWYAALLAPKAAPGDTFVLVEPDRGALPTLFRTAASLASTFPSINFCVLSRAAGDGSCVTPEYPYGEDGHPRFASTPNDGTPPSVTVDGIVRSMSLQPALVKVDVEGAEAFVLGGMGETLAKAKTKVMLEVHPLWQPEGLDATQVAEGLKDVGYACRDLVATDEAVRQLWTPSV